MRKLIVALAALALPCVVGCTMQTRPAVIDGYAVVGAGSVPPNVYAYPRVWYGDRYAYLVDGRWYYPAEGGWVVFNDEPPVLHRYRTSYGYGGYGGYGNPSGGGYVHTAPPAPDAVHVAPPAYGGGPGGGVQPPPPPR